MGLQAGHLSSRAAVSSPGKWGRSLPLASDVHGLQFLPSGRPVRSGAGEPESASQPLTVGCLTREPTSSLWPPPPGLVEEKGRQGNAGCEVPPGHRSPGQPCTRLLLASLSMSHASQRPHAHDFPGNTHVVTVPLAFSLWALETQVEICPLWVQSARCQRSPGPATRPPAAIGGIFWPLAGLAEIIREWVLCISLLGLPSHRN